ncbi:hypothetical protein L218DRAFT_872850, partial [Marasmius fiardii PR-910]
LIWHAVVFNATLLVYDVIISLSAEIEYIWMSKWSFVTLIYILQRYLPFFDVTGLTLHHHFGANLTVQQCTLEYEIAACMFYVPTHIATIILALRVWALWERRLIVAIGLVVFFCSCWVPFFVFLAQFLSAMKFTTPALPNFRGCLIASGSPILYLCWVCIMVYDTGILLLMLIPGIAVYKTRGRSELAKTIYRDGKRPFEFAFPV